MTDAGVDAPDALPSCVESATPPVHESALRGVAEAAAETRREVEQERNRLAALMAQLTVAVVVCNSEGRILLYNEAARSLVDDDTLVGLGRSVFGVVDRGLVAHAYDRLVAGAESVYTAATLHRDRELQVHVTLVREPSLGIEEPGSGFVLVLEDLTHHVRAGDRREQVLRQLTEGARASLGSLRAAAESVLQFPEMTPEERRLFLEIIGQEADQLGRLERRARVPLAKSEEPAVHAAESLLGLVTVIVGGLIFVRFERSR